MNSKPLFALGQELRVLLDDEEFSPGQELLVRISLIHKYDGDFYYCFDIPQRFSLFREEDTLEILGDANLFCGGVSRLNALVYGSLDKEGESRSFAVTVIPVEN